MREVGAGPIDGPEKAAGSRRRGGIDRVDNLATLDLSTLNDRENPYVNAFLAGGFREGAAYFRDAVRKWGFAELGAVADIASGYGRWAMFLAESNERVHGFERNSAAVRLSRNIAAHFGFDSVSFEVADVTAIADHDGAFDGAWCFNTLHLVDRGLTLARIHRLLRPGGRVFIGHYNGMARVLEKFLEGYRTGGLAHPTTRFALAGMKGGPFHDGIGNYGAVPNVGEVLAAHGFTLVGDPPMEVDLKRKTSIPASLAELVRDPSRLAEKIASDEGLAAAFASHAELAYGATPMNIHFCAVRA